jgi:thioredoxin-like negative regulator of GroEL
VFLFAFGSVVEAWRFEVALDAAKRAVVSGDFRSAGTSLARLSIRRPGRPEVEYLLGVCEEALGRPEAALAALGRVASDSPYATEAALRRARLGIGRGRFADAEAVVAPFSQGKGTEAFEARRILAELFWLEGRLDELRPLIEANWAYLWRTGRSASREAIEILRTHVTLDLFPLPIGQIKAALGHASEQAPDDDRVCLARANLATRTGRFAEAEPWLDDCLHKRPDDPSVWRAVLDWALATGRADRARQAIEKLPARSEPPHRVASLRAWFAARRGDATAERVALERALEAAPDDLAAIERLAELAAGAGEVDRAVGLRRRKAELDEAVHAYRHLYNKGEPERNAVAMARLAGQLGRRFEAQGFLTLAARRNPEDREAKSALARVTFPEPRTEAPGETLADLLSTDLGSGTAPSDVRGITPGPAPGQWPSFRDDAAAAGIAFVFDNGASEIHQLPEMASGGVGLLDYDGDGWLDIYVVQGGPFPPAPGPAPPQGDRLFHNKGDGTFEDVTAATGVAAMRGGYGHGVAVGDVDNDGDPDLFVTRWRSYSLYRNNGDGTFEEATDRWGLGGDRDWPTSAAFADLDGDGDLDLYVCHYLIWDPANPMRCRSPSAKGFISCDPHLFPALPDHFFRNDGGRFVDVSAGSGLVDNDGRGLGVLAADLDGDGKIDLFVANDGTANFLLRNLGGFRFEEVGHPSGVACNAAGGYQAGMGVACGDLDADGRLDLAVTNFYGESTTFFRSLGGGQFADQTAAVGLAAPSRYLLGFGVAFLDANADGRLDLLTVNGHVSDFRPQAAYTMPAQLLLGDTGVRLVDASRRAGEPLQAPRLSRGLAVGDLDNDGKIDAVVVNQNDPLSYFHNVTSVGHSVTLLLQGTSSNRDAVGARVKLEAGGRRQFATRYGGGSYLSSGDPRLHFGLGTAKWIEHLEVQWPSGRVDRHHRLPADTAYLLREGDPVSRPLKGWAVP